LIGDTLYNYTAGLTRTSNTILHNISFPHYTPTKQLLWNQSV